MIRAYHFVGDNLRDGRPVPPDGKWLVHEGPAIMCRSGLHASRHPFDALMYAPGPVLCLVDCDEIDAEENDKLVCRRRRIVARFDATTMLRAFARQCALDVIHLWDAPRVVRDYLTTGDESLRAAARAAARDAAREAAGAAAREAAGAAARAAARAVGAAWAAAWDDARDAALAAENAAWGAAWGAALAAENAAWGAAWGAARDAAWEAARDAARAAAWDAARNAQRERFERLVAGEFARMGVTA